MSSAPNSGHKADVQKVHQAALQIVERVDRNVCGLLTDLAHAKHILLPQPIRGMVHDESHIANRCHAVWPMLPDRGRFIAKVELYADDTPAGFHLRAVMQSTIWEGEAQQYGEWLCQATHLPVLVERSQMDGIVTFTAELTPE
ncbi:MAG TPA: hypothetical protein VGK87_08990 [Anaerolineae bacterium]|jgi:hypothetical protein